MTAAHDHLHAGLIALEGSLAKGWSRRVASEEETKFFSTLPSGALEISGQTQWMSIGFGSALWEDLPFQSVRDADRILAGCDAIIDGRISQTSTCGLIKTIVTSLRLSTRGFDETLEDRALGVVGRTAGKSR